MGNNIGHVISLLVYWKMSEKTFSSMLGLTSSSQIAFLQSPPAWNEFRLTGGVLRSKSMTAIFLSMHKTEQNMEVLKSSFSHQAL